MNAIVAKLLVTEIQRTQVLVKKRDADGLVLKDKAGAVESETLPVISVTFTPVKAKNEAGHEDTAFFQKFPSGRVNLGFTDLAVGGSFAAGQEYMIRLDRVVYQRAEPAPADKTAAP